MANRLQAFGLFGSVNDPRTRTGIVPTVAQAPTGYGQQVAGQAASFNAARQSQAQQQAQSVANAQQLAAQYGQQVQSGVDQSQNLYSQQQARAEQELQAELARQQFQSQMERDRLQYAPARRQAGSSVPGQYRPSATYNALGQQLTSTPSTGMELYDRAVGGDANAGAIIMADYNRRGLETPYEAQLAVMNQQSRTPSLRTTGSRGSVARQTGQTGTGGRLGGWGGRQKWGGA